VSPTGRTSGAASQLLNLETQGSELPDEPRGGGIGGERGGEGEKAGMRARANSFSMQAATTASCHGESRTIGICADANLLLSGVRTRGHRSLFCWGKAQSRRRVTKAADEAHTPGMCEEWQQNKKTWDEWEAPTHTT